MGILESLFRPNIEKLKSRKEIKGLLLALAYDDLSIQKGAAIALHEIGNSLIKEFSLVYAVFRSQLETVTLMLETYASGFVNKTGIPGLCGCSILFYPAMFNKSEIVEVLLRHGADPNVGRYSPLSQAKLFRCDECTALLESIQAREGDVLIDIAEEIDCMAIESQVVDLASYTDNLLGLLGTEAVNAEREGSEWVRTGNLLRKWEAEKKISWRYDHKEIFRAKRIKRHVLERALVRFLAPRIVDDPRSLAEWEANKKPEVVVIHKIVNDEVISLEVPLSRAMQELISSMHLPETARRSKDAEEIAERRPFSHIKTLEEVAQRSLAVAAVGFARAGASLMAIRDYMVSDKETKGMVVKKYLETLFSEVNNDILYETLKQIGRRCSRSRVPG